MIFDFKVPFVDVSGQENGKLVSEALREILGSMAVNKEDTLTHLQWLQELRKDGTLDLGEGERKKLLDTLLNSNQTFTYVKEQYLAILDKKPE